MKTIISYRFDLNTIKNHEYFKIKKDIFSNVYFIPLNKQVLFISPTQENIYITLSEENNETIKIKDYIHNTIENDILNFNNVFAIDKREFSKFLKNANKKDSFYFDIILYENEISGNCNILKHKKDINDNTIDFDGEVKKQNSNEHHVKILLELLLFKNYEFKKIDWNKKILNINLKYYSLINKCLDSYQNKFTRLKFYDDEINKLTNVVIEIDDKVNIYYAQILIAHMLYEEYNNNQNDKIEDVLSTVKKHLFAKKEVKSNN